MFAYLSVPVRHRGTDGITDADVYIDKQPIGIKQVHCKKMNDQTLHVK